MRGWYFQTVGLSTVLLSLSGLSTHPARAEYQFETIALTGDIAPGSGGSSDYQPFIAFDNVVLNAQGEVAFRANTSVNADGGDSGVFITVGGTLNAIAFEQQIAPGSGGSGADVPFTSFDDDLVLSDIGEIAFEGFTSDNIDGGNTGIFSTTGGSLHAVAFEGQIAPGSGGSGADVPFFSFSEPVINTAGEVAFSAFTLGNADGGNEGIFSTVGGTLDAVAFDGQIAPGSGGNGDDVPFRSFVYPVLNDQGEIAFAAIFDGGDIGIFSTVGGTLDTVAFEGQIAPGSGGSGEDVPFTFFSGVDNRPAFNDSGEIAFGGITLANADGGNIGIFSTVGGALDAVAFEGQLAPGSGGGGPDLTFHVFQPPVLNEMSEMAFSAFLGGPTGIFSTVGGTLDAVAISGQIAPGSGGTGDDVPFSGLWPTITLAMNEAGELAFRASTSTNTDGGNEGIFSTLGGALNAVVFEGDEIEVAPGDFRTIETLSSISSEHFNDLGQLLFLATFTDGSGGIILATPVPEPCTAALTLIGIVGCSFWISQRRSNHR